MGGDGYIWICLWVVEGGQVAAESSGAGLIPVRPDPSEVESVAEFVQALRRLRVWSGNPSISSLSKRTGLPRTTVYDALSAKRAGLPSLDLVRRFLAACGCAPKEVATWESAWRSVQERVASQAPGGEAQAGAVAVVPRQLPNPGQGFVGRRAELKRLDSILQEWRGGSAGPAVAVISGPGGIGKTTLATHWAHEVADHFPDGHLYLNLDGFSSRQPMTVEQALTLLLRGLGVEGDRVPADALSQAALYRSLSHGRHMMILLDNAVDVAQVRPLMPGSRSCFTVVTSRNSLRGLAAREGAQRVSLGRLNDAEALRLLSFTLGAERVLHDEPSSSRLVRLCGNMPLALRIAAANLADRPFQTVEDYAAELESGDRLAALSVDGDDESTISAVFLSSYERQQATGQRLFRRLGLIPGADFSVDTAAVLLDTDVAAAHAELETLAAGHLVEPVAQQRFVLHDLLRLLARSLVRQEEPQHGGGVWEAMMQWYLDSTVNAVETIRPGLIRLAPARQPSQGRALSFQDSDAARHWLDTECGNLVAAVTECAEEAARRRYAWLITDALRGYFMLRIPKSEWLAAARAGLEAARDAGDTRAEAAMRACLGDAARAAADHPGAIRHYGKALHLCRVSGDRRREAAVMSNLGLGFFEEGNLAAADHWLTEAAAAYRDLGDSVREATGLARLGSVQRDLGKLGAAENHLRRAIAWHKGTGEQYQLADATARLGIVLRYQGHLEQAIECARSALTIYEQVGDRPGIANALEDLALANVEWSRPEPALEFCTRALGIAQELEDARIESDVLRTVGAARHLIGAPDADEPVLESLQAARAHGHKRGEIGALLTLAEIARSHEALDDAIIYASQALHLSRNGGLRLLEPGCLAALAFARSAAGEPEPAIAAATEALAMFEDSGQQLAKERITVLLEQLHGEGQRDKVEGPGVG